MSNEILKKKTENEWVYLLARGTIDRRYNASQTLLQLPEALALDFDWSPGLGSAGIHAVKILFRHC